MSNASDPFVRMIELMAKTLGYALNKLIGLKQSAPENSYNYINDYLQSELKFNLTHFLNTNNELITDYLSKKSFNTSHSETLAKILFELTDTIDDENEKINLLIKSKLILNWVSSKDKTYSLEREKLITLINSILNNDYN